MCAKSLTIKRLDKRLSMPYYKSEGAVGIDLYARETVMFNPAEMKVVPLNVVIKTPDKYATLLVPRSSLYRKKGLLLANSLGVIDRDYCGNKDAIMAPFLYVLSTLIQKERIDAEGKLEQKIERGERVCQMLLTRIDNDFDIVETDDMEEESRGGFGSTGGYNNVKD